MTAYYNENDSFAAEWLRNLIKAGHIADGVVDERSIVDVEPAELADYTQCHFFAGVGVWSLALRNAGWPDDRPVWTGSCPCQPFSSAGKGSGFDDERHLWPAFEWLIRQCRPATIIGEQVASKDADSWVDLVQDDLEGMGYAFGAIPFPAASVGAPHIRDRLFWVAHTAKHASKQRCESGLQRGRQDYAQQIRMGGVSDGLADTPSERRHGGQNPTGADGRAGVETSGADGGVGDTSQHRPQGGLFGWADAKRAALHGQAGHNGATLHEHPAPTNGHWRDADWLYCRDGKWRPVEPGTFPLAHGLAARVGRLRAYGNAINAEQARIFIETVMECIDKC